MSHGSFRAIAAGRGAWLLALLLLCLALYWPGLSGDFFLDDQPHITHNDAIQIAALTPDTLWAAANSTNSGPMGRPLALASFALNYHFSGLDPFYFKLVNLLLHLFTGLGIYLLVQRLARRLAPAAPASSIALLTTAIWLLHPLNVSTVLYAVQRMTVLAALCTVWAMVAYCHGRECLLQRSKSGWWWIITGFAIGGVGLYAKETAVLLGGYLLVIEWLVFRFAMPTARQRHALQLAYALAIGLPLVWALATHLTPGWIESAYAHRPFTLLERLLTQSRVLWDYLSLTWLPNIQSMGLYHDGYVISRGLLDPPATLATLLAHATLAASAWLLRTRWPWFAFAVAWFYVGHSAEATLLPLEIKYEHRHYLPMLGMVLLMAYGIHALTERLRNTRRLRAIIIAAVLLTFGTSTLVRAAQFGDFWGFARMEAEHHPESARANQSAAVSLMKLMLKTGKTTPELTQQTITYLQRSTDSNPDSSAALFTAVLFLPEITGQPPAQALLQELTLRLANAKPDANISSFFLGLLRQAERGRLRLSHAQAHMLFEHVASNPHVPEHVKSDILAAQATYAQSIEHDNLKARRVIDRAIALAPESSGIHVPAVWIYQEAGLWQDAGRLLQQLKKLDTLGIERNNIAWLSQRQAQHP